MSSISSLRECSEQSRRRAHPNAPIGIRFRKVQSIGNDFVVIVGGDIESQDAAGMAIAMCNRRRGVGADGLILLGSEGHRLFVRMFNPDGTEDVSGNGFRCAVHEAFREGRIDPQGEFASIAGVHAYEVARDGVIAVDMGCPEFSSPQVPVRSSHGRLLRHKIELGTEVVWISVVWVGSLHTVVFVDSIPGDAFFTWASPRIERLDLLEQPTSVLWAVVETPRRISLRIWERGVGETLGCGTGACAASAVASLEGHVEPVGPVMVESRGGRQVVSRSSTEGPIRLSGVAHSVFCGTYRNV